MTAVAQLTRMAVRSAFDGVEVNMDGGGPRGGRGTRREDHPQDPWDNDPYGTHKSEHRGQYRGKQQRYSRYY